MNHPACIAISARAAAIADPELRILIQALLRIIDELIAENRELRAR